jgi:hypothetical protein
MTNTKMIIKAMCFCGAFLGLVGTAGALENNSISLWQSIVQFIVCFAILAVTVKGEYTK